ncbi:unnamed protein product [Orchesella dallaii]|uniref:Uncharacterized protein n=1 Tax=Orchesella dallaii TaxID=48710 RepID=A0ABP1QZD0_9HEXA
MHAWHQATMQNDDDDDFWSWSMQWRINTFTGKLPVSPKMGRNATVSSRQLLPWGIIGSSIEKRTVRNSWRIWERPF